MVVVSLGGISLDACSHSPATKKMSSEPQVILTVHGGVEVPVIVELARTEAETRRGLMFRQALASGRGMLFLFEESEPHRKFWMKNTYIPLDIIFIADDLRIVYVEENAEPLTLIGRGPEAPSRYVLEVPGGWARAHGVEPGIIVRFLNVN